MADPRLRDALCGVQAVLFDIDHTLVDTAGAFAAALRHAVTPLLGADADHDAIAAQWSRDRSGWYRAYTRGEVGYGEQRHRRIDEVLTDRDARPLDADGFAVFDRAFDEAFAAAWRPFPDAIIAVRRLRAAGLPLGAMSNAAAALQTRKLTAVGLAESVPLLATMDTFGVGKPDPRMFLEGARRLGTDPAHVVYVGDEPDIDADAATAAGLIGVHLQREHDRRFERCRPDQRRHLEVGDLTALADALALPSPGPTG